MKKGYIQGFELVRERFLSELDATLFEYRHTGCGAQLIYLDREDENKSFAIAFPTPPSDDTGVFHIIEHSVLCGSEKYPLKDPFAELLKGSLNTFLNAITYEDRTIYPVSSRCEKDFLNLMDVYMDAVLAPKMLENPSIFAQEGWHYEYDAEADRLSYNGVVYNEMKGAYSSPDEVGALALYRSLFPDSIYSRDSGGDPDRIPDLTYEQLKATHEKHYHPSGARIILDGKMDLERALGLINSHLCRYEKREAVRLDDSAKPLIAPLKQVSFEISPKEDSAGRSRMLFGYVFADYTDRLSQMQAGIICDLLCGSNASPLKRALLDEGLCKDAVMYVNRSKNQTLIIEIRDTDPDKYERIAEIIEETVRSTVNDGIDRSRLEAIINHYEFKLREMDFGSLPSGVAFAMTMFGYWMYGGAPEESILTDDAMAELKSGIDSGAFEATLRRMILDCNHKASVIMIPDPTLSEKATAEREERLRAIRESMTDEELDKIVNKQNALRQWQEEDESDEAIASLPTLSLSDVPENGSMAEVRVEEKNGIKILYPQVKTNGIVYIYLYFNLQDLANEDLFILSLMTTALLNYRTKTQDPLTLQSDIKANLGSFFCSAELVADGAEATPYLKVGASALLTKQDELLRILEDVLLGTQIDDCGEIEKLLAQAKSQVEDVMISSGESVALARVEASISEAGAISEYLSGYEAYKIICDALDREGGVRELTDRVRSLYEKIFSRDRLTVSVTGAPDGNLADRIIAVFPKRGEISERRNTALCADKNEFFLIPSKVAYAVIGGRSDRVRDNLGALRVARSILSYEYLWNTVRVKSGAYGTGFVPRRDGGISFYSYRDPSPARSIEFYKESTDYLRSLAEEGEELTKFIIGAIGEYDVLTTPRTSAMLATRSYMSGWGTADEARVRRNMLSMRPEDLLLCADIIDEALKDYSQAVVGGREHLDSLPEKPSKIYEI